MIRSARGVAGAFLVAGLLALGAAGPISAQSSIDWDPRGAQLSRAELSELLDRLEVAASSPGYSASLRAQAAEEAEVVRQRLQSGDFQVGDKVVLYVEGEPQLSDTLSVAPGRVLQLPEIEDIPLDGILRSELEAHLETELGRYLRDPDVEANSLVRIAVLGQVGRQGFYTMPASLLVEEALMLAGGPGGNANLDDAEIQRGDRVIWSGDALQEAIIEGRTLDQLSLRAGDRIIVPQRRPGFFDQGILRTLLFTIPAVTYAIIRIL
jgi:protein involved in polysaccharide export with SLBB domain